MTVSEVGIRAVFRFHIEGDVVAVYPRIHAPQPAEVRFAVRGAGASAERLGFHPACAAFREWDDLSPARIGSHKQRKSRIQFSPGSPFFGVSVMFSQTCVGRNRYGSFGVGPVVLAGPPRVLLTARRRKGLL